MSIMHSPRKRKDVLTEIVQDVKLKGEVLYVKVTEKRLTTSDHTAQAVYVVYQLVWSVAARIGYGNLSALEAWLRHK